MIQSISLLVMNMFKNTPISHPVALQMRLRTLIASFFKFGAEAPNELHQSAVAPLVLSLIAIGLPNKFSAFL